MRKPAARNIILLSDGTGNSSLSPTKSNVWRIYQALDLGPDRRGAYKQIAFYDNGVGTSRFKPLYLLGSAFGWGLSRNVRKLYENLCRNYRPGDKIYLFGFSRGAFTVRLLADFISKCGIIDQSKFVPNSDTLRMNTDEGLRKGVRLAHKSYRRGYWDNASWFLRAVSKPLRFIRNKVFKKKYVPPPEKFLARYSHEKPDTKAKPGKKLIEFIGVWDTVDALGLPVDELASVLNWAVYPYQLPNQKFSPDVGRACHGLAIDDERQSFRPLLWDESGEKDPNRIKQVWFAGMHSNVGGSYPEDHLAYIALDWMIGETAQMTRPVKPGLIFNKNERAAIKQKAQPLGKMYDSRRGAAVYYRYKPRRIHDLCHDKVRDVTVKNPKIHHSVLDRIRDNSVGYAPTALPGKFSIIGKSGKPVRVRRGARYYESDEDNKIRIHMLERAQNHIFWRRVSYFALLALTFCLFVLPLFPLPILTREASSGTMLSSLTDWVQPTLNFLQDKLGWLLDKLTYLLNYVSSLPEFTRHWTQAWVKSPLLFAFFFICFVGFYAWTNWIIANTQRIAEAGWWHTKNLAEDQRYNGAPKIFERFAGWLRGTQWYNFKLPTVRKFLIPALLVIGFLLLAGPLSYRYFLHRPFVKDGVCNLPNAIQEPTNANVITNTTAIMTFDTRTPCHDTGFEIIPGRKYKVAVNPGSKWIDKNTPAGIGGLEKYSDAFSPFYVFAIPAKRHIFKSWFALLGTIGRGPGNVISLGKNNYTFTAAVGGRLYLYVNDAINPASRVKESFLPDWVKSYFNDDWRAYYKNNSGTAIITITAQD